MLDSDARRIDHVELGRLRFQHPLRHPQLRSVVELDDRDGWRTRKTTNHLHWHAYERMKAIADAYSSRIGLV